MRAAVEAFFLPAQAGQRLCLYHPPAGDGVRGAVVYVHPWAEEMNKSRRMAALQARAMAAAGYAVLQIDLHGCGDSSGDFGDATWATWTEDVRLAARWLQARHDTVLWLWGLRAGCLLAVEAARGIESPLCLLLWQPIPSGRLVLQQFLRLKAAAALGGESAKEIMADLRRRLTSGEALEIAGYAVAPPLAAGLERATLDATRPVVRLEWIEVATRHEAALLPASVPVIRAWRDAGASVRTTVVEGPSFWQTTEIEDAPALIPATLDCMQASTPG